ncbi:MAG TPA: carboxypeptidase-like regulatory domain-containing protein [Thermoanaerobaculia bacterium]|nr:carboxypeptidase-like regulatory domain-containing protein [Thermoanaerobaculia bacterium]
MIRDPFVGPWLLALCVLAVVAPQPLRAQGQADSGALEGTVGDETGAVLPGVAVSIKNQATGVERNTTTDARGTYHAPLLPVGNYDVTAALQGFATARHPGLPLTVGQTLRVDLTLKVAAAEAITVTAEAPVLEATRTAQAATVGPQAVANLPVNGRNFIDFVLTTPDVTTCSTSPPAISSARATSTSGRRCLPPFPSRGAAPWSWTSSRRPGPSPTSTASSASRAPPSRTTTA